MQMLVLPSSGGFAPVAPMLFTSQLTLAISDTHHDIRWEKMGKVLFLFLFSMSYWAVRIVSLAEESESNKIRGWSPLPHRQFTPCQLSSEIINFCEFSLDHLFDFLSDIGQCHTLG